MRLSNRSSFMLPQFLRPQILGPFGSEIQRGTRSKRQADLVSVSEHSKNGSDPPVLPCAEGGPGRATGEEPAFRRRSLRISARFRSGVVGRILVRRRPHHRPDRRRQGQRLLQRSGSWREKNGNRRVVVVIMSVDPTRPNDPWGTLAHPPAPSAPAAPTAAAPQQPAANTLTPRPASAPASNPPPVASNIDRLIGVT